ncbi:MAG TPA: metalloregulator ArsR/SmtB family transcription factor [Oligoflexia bacterium]|nr:metalloregulator ArsR/SmtB family transcription factor [Oligoflexia bacterium]HMR25067.1 metalloregulator ArsR/SmtB family transcription factor [Oligoflexia bacterium]
MKKTNLRNKKIKFSQHELNNIAEKFKVLSEPLRLAIIQFLMDGEKNVTDIHMALNSSQPNISKHLKVLEQAGFLNKEKHAVSVYYTIADPMVFKLCQLVCKNL